MSRYFQVMQGGLRYGNAKLDSSVSTAYNGYVLKMASDGELEVVSADSDAVFGLLYEHMNLVELPTSENVATYLAGKRVGTITGHFFAMVGKSLFNGGSIPSVGDTIYSYGNGLLSNADGSGSATVLGKCISTAKLENSDDADSGQSYETVAVVEFDF